MHPLGSSLLEVGGYILLCRVGHLGWQNFVEIGTLNLFHNVQTYRG